MRRFKTVEELNMETVVELTVEEKTQAFEVWVKQRLDIQESGLSTIVHHLEYWLNNGEPMSDDLFNNKFETEYFFVNEDIKNATHRCKVENLPEDVLAKAITEFKQMKSKMRKVKVEYKQKFTELKAAIAHAQENETYVNEIRTYVQDIIIRWCSTYVIIDNRKSALEGEKLSDTVAFVTRWILNSKLHPSQEEIKEFVEKYMANHTVTVAC